MVATSTLAGCDNRPKAQDQGLVTILQYLFKVFIEIYQYQAVAKLLPNSSCIQLHFFISNTRKKLLFLLEGFRNQSPQPFWFNATRDWPTTAAATTNTVWYKVERAAFHGIGSLLVAFYLIKWFHSHDVYQMKYYWFQFKVTGIIIQIIWLKSCAE